MGSDPGYLLKSFLLYVHVKKKFQMKKIDKKINHTYFRIRGLAKIPAHVGSFYKNVLR